MHTILKWIDYNRYFVIGLILAIAVAVGAVGCNPKVTSPLTGKPVTHAELVAEVEIEKASLETQ